MQLRRFIKSLINVFLCLINAILWIFNVISLGELIVGVQVGKNRQERFLYGVSTIIQYCSYVFIVGLVLTIYWWAKCETSMAEKLSGLHIKKIVYTYEDTYDQTTRTYIQNPHDNDSETEIANKKASDHHTEDKLNTTSSFDSTTDYNDGNTKSSHQTHDSTRTEEISPFSNDYSNTQS